MSSRRAGAMLAAAALVSVVLAALVLMLVLATSALAMPLGAPRSATGVSMQAPAGAAIELSRDGVHWEAELSAPLFDPGARWVPGDSRTATFLLRNRGPVDAWLAVSAEQLPVPGANSTGALEFAARIGDGAWRPATATGTVDGMVLASADPGAYPSAVEVRVTFPASADNGTQLGETRVSIRARLTESAPSDGKEGSGGPAGGGGSGLAATGAAGVLLGWSTAALLTGSGVALLLGALRDRRIAGSVATSGRRRAGVHDG